MSSSWPAWLPLRNSLTQLQPYGAPQVPARAALNTNENPFPPSVALIAAITNRVSEVCENLNRYPDRDAIALRLSLASYINKKSGTSFTIENLWAANGSNEIIQSIFLAFGGSSALGFTPSYSMHPLIANVARVNWIAGKRDSDFSLNIELAVSQIKVEKPALTFITTPNNPTGSIISFTEISKLAVATKTVGGLLVVDEAYAEFSTEDSAVKLISEFPNVIVIRTMSKAFAFAGARLGYLIADNYVISALQLVRLPYHLSAITQAVAEVALSYSSELLAGVDILIEERQKVSEALTNLGLEVIPSAANFLLFSGFKAPAATIWQELLDKGILIRDVGLLGYLRVTIGTAAENASFLLALKQVLDKGEQ